MLDTYLQDTVAEVFNDESTMCDNDDESRSINSSDKLPSDIRKPSKGIDKSLLPISILLIHLLQGQVFDCSLRVLFDSGSDMTFIQRRCLPQGIVPLKTNHQIVSVTGRTDISDMVLIKDLMLPEFS